MEHAALITAKATAKPYLFLSLLPAPLRSLQMGTAGEVMRTHAALLADMAKDTQLLSPSASPSICTPYTFSQLHRSLQMGTAGEVMRTHGDTAWESEMCAVARRLNLERLKLINSSQ